jgi:Rps23 Pro-64 3,4-dihydroxylase Tpa1-like proline 4-hydroxylase
MRRLLSRSPPLLAPRGARCSMSTISSSTPSPAAERAGSEWAASVTPELTQRLLSDGFCVVRDAFPPRYLLRLRDEMRDLHAAGQLYPNSTHILTPGAQQQTQQQTQTLLLEKHHVLETELADSRDADTTRTPFLRDLYDERVVFDPLQRALPAWLSLVGHMCKLQFSQGQGACFPMHFDSYGHDGKCVTAVLYLNEHWRDGDGGEIVLYPFPKPRVVLQPRFGELVLFSSQQMLHRVLPSAASRFALTTWVYCDGQASASPDNSRARAAFYKTEDASGNSEFTAMMAKVLRSPFRRHLARLEYDDEWRRSLLESHRHTQQFKQYMETQQHEMDVIRQATERMLANFRASLIKKTSDAAAGEQLPATVDELIVRMREDEEYRAFAANFQLAWF